MQLRWAPAAAEDLFRIVEYIRHENPAAAERIAKTIYESAGSLKSFPNKGSPRGRDTRTSLATASLRRGLPGP